MEVRLEKAYIYSSEPDIPVCSADFKSINPMYWNSIFTVISLRFLQLKTSTEYQFSFKLSLIAAGFSEATQI